MAEKKKIHVICHFLSKLIHYVWYMISPALVMEICRNNSNTCTTGEEMLYKKYQFIKYNRQGCALRKIEGSPVL